MKVKNINDNGCDFMILIPVIAIILANSNKDFK